MILECGCGKMFRVKDDAVSPPTKCPACGGVLKKSGGAPAAAAPDPRVASLESELQEARQNIARLEKERAPAEDARVPALEHDLQEARQSIAKLGSDLAAALGAYQDALKKRDAEIELHAARVTEIDKNLSAARAESDEKLKALRDELAQERAKQEEQTRALRYKDELMAALEAKLEVPASGLTVVAPGSERVAEAHFLVADLDRNIESISASLEGLSSRVKRLKSALEQVAPPAVAAAPAPETVVVDDIGGVEAAEPPAGEDPVPAVEPPVEEAMFEAVVEPPAESVPPETPSEGEKKGFLSKLFGKKP